MRKLRIIAGREFRLAAANKAFIAITVLGPFLIFAVSVLPGLLSSNATVMGPKKPVAVVGSSPELQARLEAALASVKLEASRVADAAEGEAGLASGEFSGCLELVPGWEGQGALYRTATGTDIYAYATIERALGAFVAEGKLAAAGLNPGLAGELLAVPGLRIVKLGEARERKNDASSFTEILYTTIAFVLLLYMSVLLYGQMIGRSVVQEKTSKTVEIMLSTVSPRELMFGKILGLGAAGILQYAIWAAAGIVLVKLAGPAFGLSLPAVLDAGIFLWLALFFVLAFFLYASCYAAVGAAAEDEHHMGQLSWPLLIFLMIPMVLVGNLVMNPDSPLCVFLSFFPMTSPIVMLMRILVTSVPGSQVAIAVALLAVSIAGAAFLAAKIFRVGILMTGKKASLSEIARWAGAR